jgi:protein TonB
VERQAQPVVQQTVESVKQQISQTVMETAAVQEREKIQESVLQETNEAQTVAQSVPLTPAQVINRSESVPVVESATPVETSVAAVETAAPIRTDDSAPTVSHRPIVEQQQDAVVTTEASATPPVPPVSVEAPAVPAEPPPAPAESLAAPPAPSVAAESPPIQTETEPPTVARDVPVRRPLSKADDAWLAESLHRRIVELRHYPSTARLNGWEGKVVLRVTIRQDGHLERVAVVKSSGHESLDHAAMEAVRRACPLHMKHPIHTPTVIVQVPINYSLNQ